MKLISSVFGWLFGWPMWAIYHIVGNYGISIIIFTILAKGLLSCMQIPQIRNKDVNVYVKKKVKEIKERYAYDPKKMEEELLRVYNTYNTTGFSGVFVSVLHIFIIYGVLNVFYNPVSHIFRISKDGVETLATTAQQVLGENFLASAPQLSIIDAALKKPELFSDYKALVSFNMNFFGINLCTIPKWGLNPTAIFPILVILVTFIPVIITVVRKIIEKRPAKEIGELLGISILSGSLLVGLSLNMPVAMSLYWVVSGIVSWIFDYLLKKYIKVKEVIPLPEDVETVETNEQTN